MVTIHKVNLTEEDRSNLHDLLKVGEHPARTIARGYVLLLASQGKNDEEIAQTLEIGRATVQRIRKRSCQKGLDHALNELPRPGAAPRLNGKQEAYVVALACSDPPAGRTCWTLQLLANQLVQLHIVEEISYETVRRVLKKTTAPISAEAFRTKAKICRCSSRERRKETLGRFKSREWIT